MTRDRRLIYAAAFLRSVAVGAVGVFAAIDLGARGFSVTAIGIVVGAGTGGRGASALGAGRGAGGRSDRFQRVQPASAGHA